MSGKGDGNRTSNFEVYRENHERIFGQKPLPHGGSDKPSFHGFPVLYRANLCEPLTPEEQKFFKLLRAPQIKRT